MSTLSTHDYKAILRFYNIDYSNMKNKQVNFETEKINKHDGDEAYQTLINWVKSVPNAIMEIEESGTEEDGGGGGKTLDCERYCCSCTESRSCER